jgi:ubiquinone/menaquinone biosynthesis C-methylase UbiE
MDKAEFDQFAAEYLALHAANIRASGEAPEFFARYKVADALQETRSRGVAVARILDFGAGIGNSIPFFTTAFAGTELTCADVSARCLELSRHRFPKAEVRYLELAGEVLPFADEQFDLAFSACVFHHIRPEEHGRWLAELRRVTARNGVLMLFEHNPYNLLTVSAVRNCPFDANARLVDARTLGRRARACGWEEIRVAYRIFFPHLLAFARPAERFLRRLPLGAQYSVSATRP